MMKLNARRIIWIIVAVIVSGSLYAIYMYNDIQQDYWKELRAAKQAALQQTDIVEIAEVQQYHGEEAYQVVFGKTEEDRELIAWIQQNEVIDSIYADEGMSKDEIAQIVTAAYSGAKIIRTVPAIMNDRKVWEVYYNRTTDRGVRSYYSYYDFSDGAWLDTYSLALKH